MNYLNHKLIKYDGFGCEDYICTKCNVIVYCGHYGKEDIEENPYIIVLNSNDETGSISDDLRLDITCEEMIIKNIIE